MLPRGLGQGEHAKRAGLAVRGIVRALPLAPLEMPSAKPFPGQAGLGTSDHGHNQSETSRARAEQWWGGEAKASFVLGAHFQPFLIHGGHV